MCPQVVAPSATDPVTSALQAMAHNPSLASLFARVLDQGWRRWGMPADDLPVLLAAALAEPADATGAVHRAADYLTTGADGFSSAYRQARAAKFEAFAGIIGPHVRPGLICDVGAGDTQLIQRLPVGAGQRSVATDIVGTPTTSQEGRFSFVLQPGPDRLPLADGSATTVLATGMLHHMDPTTRTALLGDIWRCLRPDGVLVLLEETYPAQPWESRSATDELFQALEDCDRRAFLAATDWWGNRVMKNLPEVLLPCTFLDLADWEALLPQAGLAVSEVDYLGVVDCGGHIATPRALIVAQPV